MLRSGLVTAAIASAVAMAILAAAPASAVVPPKNCGNIAVNGKTFNIKADQLRCKKARGYSRNYLRSHSRPSGYQCQDFGSGTRIKFRCASGIKVFFAIRR